MVLIPFARDVLRVAIKVASTNCEKDIYRSAIQAHGLTDLYQSAIHLSYQETGESYSGS